MEHIANILPTAIPNLVPAPPRSKPLKTSDQEQLEAALQDRRLINRPLVEVKQCLRSVFMLVGLRAGSVPQAEEKEFLLAFILENYGGHTAAEITLAFKLAVRGELNLPAKDVTCYENFSPLYFSRIMNAYREWAVPKYPQLPPPEKIYTAEDLKRIDEEYLQARIAAAYRHHLTINKLPCKI